MLTSIVSFIVVFTVVVLAHELGHLLFSRKAGIAVIEFGIGFGPKIFSFVMDKTQYTLNMIPILGFVRIAGLDDEAGLSRNKYSKKENYHSKTPPQKFMSIFGGPLFNLILALVLIYIVLVFNGVPRGISNEIMTISPASEAQKAGMQPGDKLLAIQGKRVANPLDAVKMIHNSPGKELLVTIERNGSTKDYRVTPRLNKKMNIGLIGFSLKPIYEKVGPFTAIYESFSQVIGISLAIIYTIGLLFIGKLSLLDLAGPVGIAQFTGQVAGQGIMPLISFTAFLSINLGILNLLPIPALDGGRLVFIIIEWARKKAIDIELENKIHQVGFTVLLILMAVITGHDILRIFRGR